MTDGQLLLAICKMHSSHPKASNVDPRFLQIESPPSPGFPYTCNYLGGDQSLARQDGSSLRAPWERWSQINCALANYTDKVSILRAKHGEGRSKFSSVGTKPVKVTRIATMDSGGGGKCNGKMGDIWVCCLDLVTASLVLWNCGGNPEWWVSRHHNPRTE